MVQSEDDARLMTAALSFSRRSLGLAAPNPSVGALVVKDGLIVGQGVTGQGGRPHGEVFALREAGALAKGATLYVTLEPCCHHGQSPPCTDAIIAAGVSRVVSALEDPNPKVAGEGYRRLRAAGIEVVTGVHEAQARRLHLGHILRVTVGRPMLSLKLAETSDGFAAGGAGAPRLLITGPLANGFVHMQRALHDAVLIGSGTALADDPLLTVRLPGLEDRKPLRVVLDARLRLSPSSRLAATAAEVPTLLLTAESAAPAARAALEREHIEVVTVPSDKSGGLDLKAVLERLAERGISRIFAEGGRQLASALLAADFADDIILLKGPKPLGQPGLPMLTPDARAKLAEPSAFRVTEERMLGDDHLRRYERMF